MYGWAVVSHDPVFVCPFCLFRNEMDQLDHQMARSIVELHRYFGRIPTLHGSLGELGSGVW